MSPITTILVHSILLFSSTFATAHNGDTTLTPYEALESYDFPMGLLPKGAKGYDLDESTGQFKAYLNGSCSFSLEGSYQLKYKSTIAGTISKGKLINLSGISVKVFFFWVNIVEVVRSGDQIGFSVGIASADFAIDNFYVCPQCGCGLDCNGINGNGKIRKIGANPFVSSI